MGLTSCCGNLRDEAHPPLSDAIVSRLIIMSAKRRKNTYKATFTGKPLYITLTSDNNGYGSYVTTVNPLAPVNDLVEINSRVIEVNGQPVEDLEVEELCEHIASVNAPMVLTLVRPAGLSYEEMPALKPKESVNFCPQYK